MNVDLAGNTIPICKSPMIQGALQVDAYGVIQASPLFGVIAIFKRADQRRIYRAKRSPLLNPFPLQILGVRIFRIRFLSPFLPAPLRALMPQSGCRNLIFVSITFSIRYMSVLPERLA